MNNSEKQKIFLTGYIDVPKNRVEAVKSALKEHISLTRAEEDCISFDVVPSDTIVGRFMVSETFTNQATLDEHQDRTKKSNWFWVTEGIPRQYSIKVGDTE